MASRGPQKHNALHGRLDTAWALAQGPLERAWLQPKQPPVSPELFQAVAVAVGAGASQRDVALGEWDRLLMGLLQRGWGWHGALCSQEGRGSPAAAVAVRGAVSLHLARASASAGRANGQNAAAAAVLWLEVL